MIQTIKNGTIEYQVSEGIAVPHCFTTRLGGVSTGIYDSLNLSLSRGDEAANVVENYRRIGNLLGFAPEDVVNARQTHSDIVLQVGRKDCQKLTTPGVSPECDGLITNEPGVALFVSTADCTPILLWDSKTGAVGAVHAGWRGTAADIAGKAVKAMTQAFGSDPQDIRAAIGPNLGVCCFETDADVPEAMIETFGEAAQKWIYPKDNKFYVNLKEINALALSRAGVRHIEISADCTMCLHHKYWSHRYTRGNRGAQGAIILCKEVQP
jgi:YfiH family protein